MDTIEKILNTYGMMVTLTPDQQQEARESLIRFLSDKNEDAHALTIAGLKFLRGEKFSRTRRARSLRELGCEDTFQGQSPRSEQ